MENATIRKSLKAVLGMSIFLVLVGCAGNHQAMDQHAMDMQLIRAAENGQTAEVKRLIRLGADINAMDSQGWTPYLAASSNGRLDAMHVLKALGAKTSTYLEQGALAVQ